MKLWGKSCLLYQEKKQHRQRNVIKEMHWAEKNGDIKLTVEWKNFHEFGSRSKKFQRHLTI